MKDFLIIEHHYDDDKYLVDNIYVGILHDVSADEVINIIDKLTKRVDNTYITYSAEQL